MGQTVSEGTLEADRQLVFVGKEGSALRRSVEKQGIR